MKFRSCVFLSLLAVFSSVAIIGCPGKPTTSANNTPTATNTPCTNSVGYTCTFTCTPTPTSTSTATATPTATVYTFAPQGFEGITSVPSGWVTWSGGPSISPLDISTAQAHTGSQSLHMSVTFTAASQVVEIMYQFSTPVNLTGKTFSYWYYLDQLPTATGSKTSIEISSLYGEGGMALSSVAGTWTQVSLPVAYGSVVPSAVTAVEFALEDGSTGPFNTVNIYLDDVTIQ